MSQSEDNRETPAPENRQVPRLNERILSSLSRRSVAAHPWHDLEIGIVHCSVLSLLIDIEFAW